MRLGILDKIQRSEDSRYDYRLHGIIIVCGGMSCYKVADLLDQSPRTIQYWVHRFERNGFADLQEHQRQGRPSVITEEVLSQVGRDL